MGDSPNDKILANLGVGGKGDGDRDGDRDGDGDGPGVNVEIGSGNDRDARGGGSRRHEFVLVNPRNININNFIGRNLHINPYVPFNNAIRRFILAQGQDGEALLQIFDTMESLGGTIYIDDQFQGLIVESPKVAEFEIAVKVALPNWTSGIVNNLVRYGICNGFDAWRKLYHKYVPLVDDLQNILVQELMVLKPVSENELDSLFNEIERITDFYAKTGTQEDLSDKWARAAILKHIPDKIAKDLAMDLRKVGSSDEMQSMINVYMRDHRIGLQICILGPMICATIGTTTEEDAQKKEPAQEQKPEITIADPRAIGAPIIAASKGGKNVEKGQRRGYGHCWDCGEYGHPRRECKVYLENMGKGQQQQDILALKGKCGNGGKWGKGKGYGGKGKSYYGVKGTNGYRSPGKVVGKGLN